MSCRLVSLDTSTKISGCALFVDGVLTDNALIDLSKMRDADLRMNEMMKQLLYKLKEWKPDIVWIEHPQGEGRNVMVVNKLSEILGAIRAYCVLRNVDYHEINPSEWRKSLGISQAKKKRDELKQMSMDFVKEKFNIDCPTDDLADSIAIGVAVINYFNSLE